MTFTTITDPIHEVTPARLQAPGVVAHKEDTLMSNQHGTDTGRNGYPTDDAASANVVFEAMYALETAVESASEAIASDYNLAADPTPDKVPAERAFWQDLKRFTDDHDTGDLSLAAKLVHDVTRRVADRPAAPAPETLWWTAVRDLCTEWESQIPAMSAVARMGHEAMTKLATDDR